MADPEEGGKRIRTGARVRNVDAFVEELRLFSAKIVSPAKRVTRRVLVGGQPNGWQKVGGG
jgi:hypothetical protein